MSLGTWIGFLLATLVVSITPGPGFLLSTGSALRGGFRVAFQGILGLQFALLCHIVLVALGLGALLAASEAAYHLLKFIGAAYLVWLGWQSWRDSSAAPVGESQTESSRAPFWQGVLVNLTNPKAILFIAALMPQFVRLGEPLALQYGVIALTTCLVDLLVMCGYALLANRLREFLRSPQALRRQRRLFGAVFMSAGAMLAISGGPR